MHNSNAGGYRYPMTEISTNNDSGRRVAAQQNGHGHGQLATEDLRLLVAAMVD